MNEQEWLTSTDPQKMLEYLQYSTYKEMDGITTQSRHPSLISERKVRLFACACCRQALTSTGPSSAESFQLCDLSDKYADGEIEYRQLECFVPSHPDCSWPLRYDRNVHITVMNIINAEVFLQPQADILRDIVGNPFKPFCKRGRPIPLKPEQYDTNPLADWIAWNHNTIPLLAQHIYDERAWGEMGVLCDALEEVGCTEQAIIRHLRESLHTRGCWCLDLLLGKE